MPITFVEKNLDAATMTVVAEYPVPPRRLWDVYADPRQIERIWGPVEWPATFIRHDMTPRGLSNYYMTGPKGERSGGYWEFLAVDPGRFFEVRDGFADDEGAPSTHMPDMRMVFTFEEVAGGTRLDVTTYFNSLEELEELLAMEMEEGMRSAMSQIDTVVAEPAPTPTDGTRLQLLSDTKVRITRVVRAGVQEVWDAYRDPEVIRQWMLGPDGWRMPVAEPAEVVGETYRFEWEDENGENRFGFTGELLESLAPFREVTSENMIGVDGPGTMNEMTLTPLEGGTLISVVITYPNAEMRDMILGTGMVDGMEASYARLESVLGSR